MMENIHWAFGEIVKDLKWMDDTTKERTLNKAQKMKTFVGYPEFINENDHLDEYYSDVCVNYYFPLISYNVELNDNLIPINFLNRLVRNNRK